MLVKSVELLKGRGVPTGKFTNTYTCDWCLWEFVKPGVRKVKQVSDQVVCPRCENFIKTWK